MRRCLVRLLAPLVVIALMATGCGSSKHKSPKPKFALTKLTTFLLTTDELPVTGFTLKPDPGIDQPLVKTAIGHYSRGGDSSLLSITLEETVSASAAAQALKTVRMADTTLTGVTTSALPFGTDGQVLRGTDHVTKDPDVEITFVQGASVITVSLLGTPTPAIPESTIVEIARRQNYKYIASAK